MVPARWPYRVVAHAGGLSLYLIWGRVELRGGGVVKKIEVHGGESLSIRVAELVLIRTYGSLNRNQGAGGGDGETESVAFRERKLARRLYCKSANCEGVPGEEPLGARKPVDKETRELGNEAESRLTETCSETKLSSV